MKLKLFISALLFSFFSNANNLVITNVSYNSASSEITFDISWDNSWKTSTGFNDAVWLFIKGKTSSDVWIHTTIANVSSTINSTVSFDNLGAYIERSTDGTGSVSGTITYTILNVADLGLAPDFKVFGIEMVKINQGSFYVGDGASTNRFHKGTDNTAPFQVTTSAEITVSNSSTTDLFTTASDSSIQLSTNIPAQFPTGFDEFYCMKYEITQEQYIEFLNTLSRIQQQTRTESDVSGTTITNRYVMSNTQTASDRNGIVTDVNVGTGFLTFYSDLDNTNAENSINDGHTIAANYLSNNDVIAYLDWAAMRPMTEIEYEKVCRGPDLPVANESAWGTVEFNDAGVITNSGAPNESTANTSILPALYKSTPLRVGCYATATSTRVQSGAGYFGNMDLSDYVHENGLIAVNDFNVLNFSYDFGDGALDENGDATNWTTLFKNFRGSSTSSPLGISVRYISSVSSNVRDARSGGRGCR
ncbi:Sulfatase-modifying factor enzyme 1 [Flavobacteriaceae bacterium MAR_2010_105]|nr:Sulfatase-modifying factor enzyme 1 [Flavobacteriaceae bacterium MAR_2010_105]